MRGVSAKSRRMHGGEVLARSSCARLARCFSIRLFLLRCFVLVASIMGFVYEALRRSVADEKKKKKPSYEYFFLDISIRADSIPLNATT